MHAPRDIHWSFVKRILRYFAAPCRRALNSGDHRHHHSSLTWTPNGRAAPTHIAQLQGSACSLVTPWSLGHPKRQAIVSHSRAEAEYRGVTNAAAECCWLCHLLGELHVPVDKATIVYYDNVSAVYLSKNPVHHGRTKHVELDVHFVREKVAIGDIRVIHIPTRQQLADIMTKGLATAQFEDFRSSLCISTTHKLGGGGGCQSR